MPSADPLTARAARPATGGGSLPPAGGNGVGTCIAGRYRVLRELGCGGMGRVWLVIDLATGAECALKQLDPEVLRSSPRDLHDEFEALTRVRHPAMVAVRELGFTPDGTPFFTMEYVPGLPADRVLEPHDWPALVRFAVRVAEGLEALHGAGLVHGDIKPSNLLVVPGEAPGAFRDVRLVDFGFAGVLGRMPERRRGTPGYAAPELVAGDGAAPATDLYAFGALLAALALRTPVSREATPPARADGLVARLVDAGVSRALASVIMRLLAPAAADRPEHAREVREELAALDPAAARPLADRLATEVHAGRDRELARLERLLAAAGRTPIARVVGDPGSGKTALLRAFAARASLGGRAVHALACAEHAGAGGVAAALARRLDVDARDAAGADVSAAAAALARALAPGALVLLDDWDRCDARSRAVLRRAALDPVGRAARWVWATRATDDEDAMLLASGCAFTLELGPLGRDDVARLVDTRLSRPAPDGLAAAIHERSGGNPGLAVALLRAAAESGALADAAAGLTFDAAALLATPIAGDFEASQLAAWETLPPGARRAVALLAVAARPLAADAPALAEAGAAVAAGLVQPARNGEWRLASPGLGAAIEARLDGDARQRAHAAALALRDVPPDRRFHHLAGAGHVAEALDWAQREATEASAVLEAAALATATRHESAARWELRAGLAEVARDRHAAAIVHLERARGALTARESRVDCLVALTSAYLRVGRAADVRPAAEEALAEHPAPAARVRLLVDDAAATAALEGADAALARAERALEFARSQGTAREVGTAARTMGGLLLRAGRLEAAAERTAEAVEAFRGAGDVTGASRTAGLAAYVERERGDRVAARRTFEAAIAEARAAGLRLVTEELLLNLGALLVESGSWDVAYASFREVARIALEDGRSRAATLALANMALLDGLTGRAARARREAIAALRLARTGPAEFEPAAWRALSQAYRIAGRLRRATRASRRGLLQAMRRADAFESLWGSIEYGRACAARGRWREAWRVWARALAGDARGDGMGRVVLAALAGRAALQRGEVATAREWLRTANDGAASGSGDRPYARAHVLQLAAECALRGAGGSPGAAAVAHALKAFAELGARPDFAAAALEFARLALHESAPLPVTDLLNDAQRAFERLGDRRGRERALELAVEAHARRHDHARPRRRGRDLIAAIIRILNERSSVRELVTLAMREVVDQLGAERGVLLLDDGDGTMVPVAECGAVDAALRDAAVKYSRSVVKKAAENGSVVVGGGGASDRHWGKSVVDLGLRSILCVPMYAGGRVIGVVYLDSQRARAFGDDDRGELEGFASLMVTVIEGHRGAEAVRRRKVELVAENAALRREVGTRYEVENCIATSAEMQAVVSDAVRFASDDTVVLLTGESGTGKEVVARLLHFQGPRRNHQFVEVNCGGMPETLAGAELFGISDRRATGVDGHPGKFELAHHGTLFLDEIAEMPLPQQVLLLRVLSTGTVTRIGSAEPIPVDVRVVAATNKDLWREVQAGRFREDLFWRIKGLTIDIPPLRRRKADIPDLARHFVAERARKLGRPVPKLSKEFIADLMSHDWPGNVRELMHYVQGAMVAHPSGELEPLYDLLKPQGAIDEAARLHRALPAAVEDLERRMIQHALDETHGNKVQAAAILGINEATLRYKMKALGMTSDDGNSTGARRNPRKPRK